MKARVVVTLKPGVLDPQGKAIEGALASLDVAGIGSVRQGKIFEIELLTENRNTAEASLRTACEKLLANTVIENFRIEIGEGKPGGPAASDAALPPEAASQLAAEDAEMPAEGHP